MSEHDTRPKRYIAHINPVVDVGKGVGVFCTYGFLTDSGEWVEQTYESLDKTRVETTRHSADTYWCVTEAEAKAKQAWRIRAMGERLIQQADELEAAARGESHAQA